ncbi:MAG: ABC transporter substrate-binding protein, partial [Bacteroidales bacterium]|nr:ABC transporter substrate-binding protein [Bacteroidales bacterium]
MKYQTFLAGIFLILTGFNTPITSPGGCLKNDTIKIGLLIQDKGSEAAIRGAELAVRKANLQGGFEGKKFSLVVRSMEGPWGTGSKQAVNLIFEEKVWALTGCHDGRNAHLVEQA